MDGKASDEECEEDDRISEVQPAFRDEGITEDERCLAAEVVEEDNFLTADSMAASAVSVVVRIRPLLEDEVTTPEGNPTPLAITQPYPQDRNKLRVVAKEGTPSENLMECGYGRVLGPEAGQQEVFEGTAVKPAVLGVAHGVSACVFAYGQTSAG
jgi:hypothetical protein